VALGSINWNADASANADANASNNFNNTATLTSPVSGTIRSIGYYSNYISINVKLENKLWPEIIWRPVTSGRYSVRKLSTIIMETKYGQLEMTAKGRTSCPALQLSSDITVSAFSVNEARASTGGPAQIGAIIDVLGQDISFVIHVPTSAEARRDVNLRQKKEQFVDIGRIGDRVIGGVTILGRW
jgi:hypothetical protein